LYIILIATSGGAVDDGDYGEEEGPKVNITPIAAGVQHYLQNFYADPANYGVRRGGGSGILYM
jgi:hypothetical protein